MNSTQLYQGAINNDTLSRKIEEETIENNKQVAWDMWRTLPQTQEFIKQLSEIQDNLLRQAMVAPQFNVTNTLVEANTVDKVLNITLNGKYENTPRS